jgi:hypothetical protein
MTAGRFSFQDLDLDPLQFGGDLYFNVTALNGVSSELINTVKIYLAKDDVVGTDKQLVAEHIWNENTMWDGSTMGPNGEKLFKIAVAPESKYLPENGCPGCYLHVRFVDAYGGSEQTSGSGY